MAPDVTERGPAEAKTLASLSLITLKRTKYLIVSTKYLSWCMPPSHGVFFLFQSHPRWITELPEPRRSCTYLQKGTACSSRGGSELHLKKIKWKIKYNTNNHIIILSSWIVDWNPPESGDGLLHLVPFTDTNVTKMQNCDSHEALGESVDMSENLDHY